MIQGSLFTRDFLEEGIKEQPEWDRLDEANLHDIRATTLDLFGRIARTTRPSEAVTEKDLIYPLLAAIGWDSLVFVQPNASKKGRSDVPDALLFGDEAALERGRAEQDSWQRFRHGICLIEAKKWQRVLDREDKGARADDGVPSTQMLRYLRRADDITEGGLRWGILTNGRHWRLYFQGALSVSEDFLEIDLGKVLNLPGCDLDLIDLRGRGPAEIEAERAHLFKLFVILFGRAAFLPSEAGASFHAVALQEGRKWEARVARDLADKVFDEVFPKLADALAKADPQRDRAFGTAYLDEVRQATLILLYRLLFVLYAEDRNLLPDESGHYADYCLTRVRQEVADRRAARRPFPASAKTYWPRLQSIFRAIAEGDDDLGIPPYNGGLFDPLAAPLLERVALNDAIVADVVYRLSHQEDARSGRPAKYINYRDLSVQQLGSVYEQILDHGLRLQEDGTIGIAESTGRRSSGSYYTPEELVGLIIERAVGPLVAERLADFRAKAEEASHDTRAVAARLAGLQALDPASRLLDLKICDPAMGSGHFLVSLVDWLSDAVLAAMAEATATVAFGTYVSPLTARIAAIRVKILGEAQRHKWPIVEAQLDDRHIVRRMVLKRVVYGVDKNPMAVELAKVALWLHSFTVGAPLSFLDHHLRCGDSVVGAWVLPMTASLRARGALFSNGLIAKVEQVSHVMAEIEETTDNDIAEVAASKSKFETVAEATGPVAAFFSLMTAETLLGIYESAPKKAPPPLAQLVEGGKSEKAIAKAGADRLAFERAAAFDSVLDGSFGDPIRIATGEIRIAPKDATRQLALLDKEDRAGRKPELFETMSLDARRRILADDLVAEARAVAARHGFFHWEIGFPNVWSNLLSNRPEGGFDAVIGNPPYVRQELLGEVKPALKKGYSAFDGMADLYVYFYEQGLKLLRPGGRMSYVVTNKWLKAGYAEALRGVFTDPERAELEFVADFGHAKHFFPDADVFPSVLVVRRPHPGAAATDETRSAPSAQVCVIPRDAVPQKGLSAAVAAASYPLPRAVFTRQSWTLEPPAVMALLEKIRRNGVPLAEYAGVKPYRGVLTGLNEAFLIDTATRDRLVRDDPKCAEIIKPYLRGQDIKRWSTEWDHLWMIFTRRGIDISLFPSIERHLQQYRTRLEPKPTGWKPPAQAHEWGGRKEGNYKWFEIQDSVEYYNIFNGPKIFYQEIQYNSAFSYEEEDYFGNGKTFIIAGRDHYLLSVLNSPLMWWHNWRYLPHMKDEALTPMGFKMESLPIAVPTALASAQAERDVNRLIIQQKEIRSTNTRISDWLQVEYDLERLGKQSSVVGDFNSSDAFVVAVRAALPKRQKLSASDVARLHQEWTTTVAPARTVANEILDLERKLSDLVNAAYGLTPEEVRLMWETAPPRMPLDPAGELRRLGFA